MVEVVSPSTPSAVSDGFAFYIYILCDAILDSGSDRTGGWLFGPIAGFKNAVNLARLASVRTLSNRGGGGTTGGAIFGLAFSLLMA